MEILLLAFALAMDSVALSIASGARCRTLRFKDAVRVAFIFGFFQALMPLLGFVLGLSFAKFIEAVDHFIAFSFGGTEIWSACAIIGGVCFALCVIACYAGRFLGEWLESKALVLGGVILILIGAKILAQHLGYLG